MNRDWVLDQESFDSLLAWLDPDRERAGQKYETIRNRLIRIFACRGCHTPEDLADETINRVAKKLKEIEATYVGERSLYFFGIANKVHLEYLKHRARAAAVAPPAPPPDEPSEDERAYECLERCIGLLAPLSREIVVQYYQKEKRAKIDHRKRMAERYGIALNALRIRAHRIRAALQRCVLECLGEGAA